MGRCQTLTLDTLINAMLDRLPRWTPALPRSEATVYLLRYLLVRLFVAGDGNMIGAHFQACQQTMGGRIYGKERRGISREWTNTLLGRLVAAGWVHRLTIKVTSDRHAPCIYSAGRQLKRLYISLRKMLFPRVRPPSLGSVNSQLHSFPFPSESERKEIFILRERHRKEKELPSQEVLTRIPLLKAWLGRGNPNIEENSSLTPYPSTEGTC